MMRQLPDLGGICGELNPTPTLSQLKRIAQHFGQTQFIATSLESSQRFMTKGWAAQTDEVLQGHTHTLTQPRRHAHTHAVVVQEVPGHLVRVSQQ